MDEEAPPDTFSTTVIYFLNDLSCSASPCAISSSIAQATFESVKKDNLFRTFCTRTPEYTICP